MEDYGIFGRIIYSPIAGTIIDVHNNEDDILPNSEKFSSLLGNYMFMKLDKTDSYLILAHLKKGSICIGTGEKVKAGELIAKVGNSGTSSEPHLHIQHQKNNPVNMRFPSCAEGLPIGFSNR